MSLIPFILDLADELHEFSRCLANGIDINDFGFGLYNGSDQQQPLQHQHQQQQQPSPRRSRTSSFSSFWMPSKRHHPYNRIKTACCAKSSEEAVATSEKLDAAPSSIGGTPAGKSASYSVVNKNGFQVSMNVKQFAPNELSVKTIDNCIVVEGRHDDKEDGHGVISRHFVRKYMLPKGYDPNDVLSTLSSDGILTVKAPPPPPPLAAKNDESNERIIEIQPTLGPTPVLVVSAKETPSKETTRKGPMASARLECQLPEKRQKLDLPAEPESKETATPIPTTTIPPLPSSISTINEIPASAAATTTAEDESNDVEMEKAEGAEQITDIYIKQSEQQKSDVAVAEYRGKKKSETYAEEKKQIIVETENTFPEETKSESNGNAKYVCEEMTAESCNNVTDATFVEKDCEIPSETTIKADTITEKSNATKMEVDEDNNINAEGNIDKTENTDHTDHIVNNKTSDTVKTITEKDTEKTNNIDTSSSSNGNSTTTITTTVNNKNTSTNIATTTNTGTTSDITENPIKGGGNDGNGVVTGKIPVDIPESADNDATSADVTAAATVATAETKAESVIDGGETDMETAVVVNTDTVTNVIDDVALLKAATADPTDITNKGDEENVILAESIDGITTTDTTTITDSVECSLFTKKTLLGNGNNATTTLVGAEEMAN